MDLLKQYNTLYEQASQDMLAGNYVIDPAIDSTSDNRYGITLLIRPPQQIRNNIEDFLSELRTIEPAQYYYPGADLHITVMSVISCYSGFNLASVSVRDYIQLIEKSLKNLSRFEFSYKGITASPAAIMIQGFPADTTLDTMRNNLRSNFKNSGLEQTIDKRYPIVTAHTTIARFRQQLNDNYKLVSFLDKYRTYDFGKFIVDEAELVYNDWYQRAEKVKQLHRFRLK